jgi:hypothetical protein
MRCTDQTLQIEIALVPAKRRKGARPRSAAPKEPEPPRIPRIARLMALAIKFQEMVNSGRVRDYADLARLGCVTRARLTQIMNLLLLDPKIQERILSSERQVGRQITERDIRFVVMYVHWQDQQHALSTCPSAK